MKNLHKPTPDYCMAAKCSHWVKGDTSECEGCNWNKEYNLLIDQPEEEKGKK
jgi:hypothetical protein